MRLQTLAIITFCSQLTTWSSAATIQWGGEFLSSDYLSDGTEITDTETPGLDLTFALGTFDSGFTPTATNIASWVDNWNELTTTSYNLELQFFTDSFVLKDNDTNATGIQFNGSTFEAGEQIYLWGYNSQSASSSSEWLLGLGLSSTDTGATTSPDEVWEIPDIANSSQSTNPLSLRVSNTTQAILGNINGIEGGGTTDTTPGTPDLQFATVPEPSVSALLACLLLTLTLRSRR